MDVKRLFVATFVSRNLFERHYQTIQDNFKDACSGKWTELENLHFTYKFLGNVATNKIPEIAELLKDNLIEYTSTLKFNGLGILGNLQNPNVLYSRVYSPDKSVLANFLEIEKKMTKYGFKKERQKFLPHITLLRIKKSEESITETFEKNKDVYIGKQINYRINLVASTLTQLRPVYEIIA